MTPHGHFHWNELNTRNAEKACNFYTKTLGWVFTPMEMPDEGGTYWLAMDNDKPICGIFTMQGSEFDGIPDHWFSYISVHDLDKRLEIATSEGGKIIRPPFVIPDTGTIAIIQDNVGAAIGWMTPSQ